MMMLIIVIILIMLMIIMILIMGREAKFFDGSGAWPLTEAEDGANRTESIIIVPFGITRIVVTFVLWLDSAPNNK